MPVIRVWLRLSLSTSALLNILTLSKGAFLGLRRNPLMLLYSWLYRLEKKSILIMMPKTSNMPVLMSVNERARREEVFIVFV